MFYNLLAIAIRTTPTAARILSTVITFLKDYKFWNRRAHVEGGPRTVYNLRQTRLAPQKGKDELQWRCGVSSKPGNTWMCKWDVKLVYPSSHGTLM